MKLNLDLNIHFWIGLAIFISTGVASGGINLSHMIPDASIPYATAWLNFFSFIGSGYLTAALGMHNASPEAKIEAAAALPEVRGIVTTMPATAEAAPSEKVVATAADIPKV